MTSARMQNSGLVGALALLALNVVACGSGSESTGGEAPDLEGAAGDGPLYALGVRVITADSRIGLLLTVPSIEEGTAWNLDRAVEVGQDAWLTGTEGEPDVLISSSLDATVQRWHVQPNGSLREGDLISFNNLGLSRSRESQGSTSIYLRDKAYFLSSDGQLVVWSPREMAILGTIPYDAPEGMTPEGRFVGDEESVQAVLSFIRDERVDPTVYPDDVRLIEIDPRTDQVVSEVDDTRCTNLTSLSVTPGGVSYFTPRAPITSYQATLGEGHGPKNCSLRIVPPSSGFDTSFDVDLTTLVGGRPAGGLVMVDDEVAFLRVWHEELAPPLDADQGNIDDLTFASAYQWWRWPVGSDSAELVAGQVPTTGQWDPFEIEGRTIVPVVAADYSSTQLFELLPEGGMRPLISGPGTLLGIVRVR